MSRAVGRPLVFGAPLDSAGVPLVKTHSEPITIKGFEKIQLSVGRSVPEKKGATGMWSVTELLTGLLIGGSDTTREKAIAVARESLDRIGPEKFQEKIEDAVKSGKVASQAELESRWLKWAEEE